MTRVLDDRLLADAGFWKKVVEFFKAEGDLLKAGNVTVHYGNPEDAVPLFRKSGNLAVGARRLEHAKAYKQAFRLYKESGNLTKCARMLEKLKDYRKAAATWKQLGDEKRRQACLARVEPKEGPKQRSLFENLESVKKKKK